MGLVVVRETREQAQRLSVPRAIQADLLEAAALVPEKPVRIDDPTIVARLRVRLTPLDGFDRADLDGEGQSAKGDEIEILDPEGLRAYRRPAGLERFLRPEPFLESDDPEIRAEAGARHRGRRRRPQAGGGPRPPRPRAAREEADRQPALGARGAADEGRRLQRAHRALRGAGPRAGPAGPHRGRPRLPARRLLLPRLAGGLGRRGARARAVAARRPDAQPVPGRRHARPPRARRPRPPDRDPGPGRTRPDRGAGRREPGGRRDARARRSPALRPAAARPAPAVTRHREAAGPRRPDRGTTDDPDREPRQELRLLHGRRRRQPRRAPRARSTASSVPTAPARPRPST